MSSPVALREVSVELGGTLILDRLSLDIAPGSWVGLIGPNGAGKTTALRCIGKAVDFDGEVTLGSMRVGAMAARDVALQVAMVPQHPILPEGMEVVDYVLLGRTPHRGAMISESEHDLRVVGEVMQALDLDEFSHRDVASLSGGELQRVVIARALAQQTTVLLLDEPTTALDIGKQQEVMELIDRLRHERRLTVLSAMHDLTVAGQFTDRLVMMADGRIVAAGAASDVLTPDLIRRYYGAAVRVEGDGAGGVVVIPLRDPGSGGDEAFDESADGKADPTADEPDEEILEP